jgi:hypothetical protein
MFMAVALIACLSIGACRKTAEPGGQSNAGSSDTAGRQHPEGGSATIAETKFFTGSIGNALGLEMKLIREADKLTGSYFYQKIGKKIDVRGTVDGNGNVTLEEFDPFGKQTGVFKGTWKQDDDGAIEIAGTWSKPNSDKKTAFSLQQAPIEFTNGAEFVPRQIKEKNKKLKYEVDAEYPQLTGSTDPNYEKFNQAARSLVTRKVAKFKKEMAPSPAEAEATPDSAVSGAADESLGSDIIVGYTAALAKNDLISIEFTISSYSAGAAHPNSYSDVLNFDLKNGKQLKLTDLFQPGAKYLQAIATYCIEALKKQAKEQGDYSTTDDDWVKRGAGAVPANYQNWTITRKGLEITFDPYQVAAYAAGPQQVTVPYSTLRDIIKPDGPVAQFVK